MSLDILPIAQNVVPELEFIELNAREYIDDLSNYSIRHESSGLTFRFDEAKINMGDHVVLYTGKGDSMKYQTHSNTKTITHRYCWNLDSPLWINGSDASIINQQGEIIEITGQRRSSII